MRSFKRHFIGVALLPLLILSGLIGPGGWFCADGRLCEPAFAATCCCGCPEDGVPARDCCPGETGPHGEAGLRSSCGCYYHAEAAARAVVLKSPQHRWNAVSPPTAVTLAVAPPIGFTLALARTPTAKPARFLLSPRQSRAPPFA
jgi:hypothetical protein